MAMEPDPRRPESRPGIPVTRRTVLDRALAVVRLFARATARLAIAALVGGTLIWAAVFQAAESDSVPLLVIVGVLVLVPPAILFLAVLALRALEALPRRLREAPGTLQARLAEVRGRMAEVGEARRRGLFSALRSLFRLGWSVASSRELLELSPALALLTPGMLVATLLAAGAAVIEVVAGAIALLVVALS
jgi:hypothetical protein